MKRVEKTSDLNSHYHMAGTQEEGMIENDRKQELGRTTKNRV